MSKRTEVRWEDGAQAIEQGVFRQLLQRLPFDFEGKILNFTLNSESGILDIQYKLGFKSSKEIATVLKRNMKALPHTIHNKNAMERMMKAEWRGYKDVCNRIIREKKEEEAEEVIEAVEV